MKRIKASNKREFEQACPEGEVYGQYKGLYVYIQLGKEEEYIENTKDDSKTNYRLFRDCYIEYSQTEQQSEEGIYQLNEGNVDVILYW